MIGRSTHWLTGLSLLGIAGLGTVVAYELTDGAALAPQVTAAAPASTLLPEAAPEPNEFRPPPQRQFNEISARPLFFPSRRPYVPAADGTGLEAVAEPAAELELIGVLMTERRRAALLQPADQPVAQWVREQQTVAGWLVEEIAPDQVRLREGDRVSVLELRDDQVREPNRSKRKGRRAARKAARDKRAAKAE